MCAVLNIGIVAFVEALKLAIPPKVAVWLRCGRAVHGIELVLLWRSGRCAGHSISASRYQLLFAPKLRRTIPSACTRPASVAFAMHTCMCSWNTLGM